MRAVCPNNPEHKTFVTVAHVAEDWVVSDRGDFVAEVGTGEVTHGPDRGNTWTCHTCGAQAIVED